MKTLMATTEAFLCLKEHVYSGFTTALPACRLGSSGCMLCGRVMV